MPYPLTLQRGAFVLLWLCLAFAACQKKLPASTDAIAQSSFATAPTSVEPLMPATVARLFERSCKSCHGPAGYGIAAIAPDIRKAPARTVEQWKQYFTTGHPGSTMAPPTWINVDEINAIASYLANLHGNGGSASDVTDDAPATR